MKNNLNSLLFGAVMLAVAEPSVAASLKQGVFTCEDSHYREILLTVTQHPTKPNKAILNWEGKDRIVHREPTTTGAVRYEGAVSQILYIQAPDHSLVLDSGPAKKVYLSWCKRK